MYSGRAAMCSSRAGMYGDAPDSAGCETGKQRLNLLNLK